AVGVEDDLPIAFRLVVGVEDRPAHGLALRLVEERIELAACSSLLEEAVDQPGDRAAHRRVKAGILPQDSGKERRAGAREPGNEVHGMHRHPRGLLEGASFLPFVVSATYTSVEAAFRGVVLAASSPDTRARSLEP